MQSPEENAQNRAADNQSRHHERKRPGRGGGGLADHEGSSIDNIHNEGDRMDRAEKEAERTLHLAPGDELVNGEGQQSNCVADQDRKRTICLLLFAGRRRSLDMSSNEPAKMKIPTSLISGPTKAWNRR